LKFRDVEPVQFVGQRQAICAVGVNGVYHVSSEAAFTWLNVNASPARTVEIQERFVLAQDPVPQKVIDIYSQLVETTIPR
jgi:hypothetical protein